MIKQAIILILAGFQTLTAQSLSDRFFPILTTDTIYTVSYKNKAFMGLPDSETMFVTVTTDKGNITFTDSTFTWTDTLVNTQTSVEVLISSYNRVTGKITTYRQVLFLIIQDPIPLTQIPVAVMQGERAQFSVQVQGHTDPSKYRYLMESPSGKKAVYFHPEVDIVFNEVGFYQFEALYGKDYYTMLIDPYPADGREERRILDSYFSIKVTDNRSELDSLLNLPKNVYFNRDN